MIRRYLPKSTEELIHWYERYVSPLALIGGFLLDTFIFLDRVDVLFGNLLLLSYLVLAACGIAFLNAIEAGRFTHRWILSIAPYISIVIQFAFGGLFSGYLSLYSRSASFTATWIFVFAIAVLLIGNERFRKLYTRISFQATIWFTALFSYLIFFLPVVFKYIGPWMFVLSGAVSLAGIAGFLFVLSRVAPAIFAIERRSAIQTVLTIYVAFNILYFANLIPPLPLALKEAGIYHTVIRTGNAYELTQEPIPWYERYLWQRVTYHRLEGEGVYAFTAIFSPTGLDTAVRHEWEYYAPDTEKWELRNTVRFPITGGRDGGFRGYSFKNNPEEGKWRVTVRTEHGQIIGRISFVVASTTEPVLVEDVVR